MSVSLRIMIEWLCLIIVVCLCTIAWLLWYIDNVAKKEVDQTPKVPMTLCHNGGKHGLYPSSASMYIEVPAEGREMLRQEICPFCYDENMKAIDAKLKG